MDHLALALESKHLGVRARRFFGREVRAYLPGGGLAEAASCAWSVMASSYDDSFEDWRSRLDRLSEEPEASAVEALVIGPWGSGVAAGEGEPIEVLAQRASSLSGLRALYVGDVMQEEAEASWIQTDDFARALAAFPRLELLRVNGNPTCSRLQHEHLSALVLQSACSSGLADRVVAASLPRLTHLELWIGTSEYGGDATVEDLAPLLHGDVFPGLRYLGLRNAEIADALAVALAESPLLDRLEVLDLSLGALGDEGAEALLGAARVRGLRALDLSYNFIGSDRRRALAALGLEVCRTDPEDAEADDDGEDVYRFVSVGE